MLYIVRHGESVANAENRSGQPLDQLSEKGKEQAKEIAEVLANLSIKHFYSSDLLRAKETAEIINERLNLEINFDTRLREFDNGSMDGIDNRPQRFLDNPNAFGAENPRDVFARLKNFFDELREKKIDDVLIISHGGAMGVMEYYFRNPDTKPEDIPTCRYMTINTAWRNFKNTEIYEVDLYKGIK